MSHEHKVALERIIALCAKSENPTKRQIRIYDIALQGMGYLECQRKEIIGQQYQPVIQKERDKMMERRARIEANLEN